MLPVDSIRFSQNTVSGPTHLDGKQIALSTLMENFAKSGYTSAPIDVVRMPDGKLTSLDNRRLWAAYLVGAAEVPARIHEMSDPIVDKSQLNDSRDHVLSLTDRESWVPPERGSSTASTSRTRTGKLY